MSFSSTRTSFGSNGASGGSIATGAITGGNVVLAAILAAVAFVVAMAWNWRRFRAPRP